MKKTSDRVDRTTGSPTKKRKRQNVKLLNITSLVDILTILLVFLVKNVSMEVQKVSIPADMDLPLSWVNEMELLENGETIIIRMLGDRILYGLESTYVGTLDSFSSEESIREALLSLMEAEAKNIRKLNKEPAVLLQADKDIDCRYITKFMFLTAKANFTNIFFSTIRGRSAASRFTQ